MSVNVHAGDYSMEEDRHLMAAEIPAFAPDVIIVESTYGVQVLVESAQSIFVTLLTFSGA
jgi:cleavage and polyadenylation specificity factor subunit 3